MSDNVREFRATVSVGLPEGYNYQDFMARVLKAMTAEFTDGAPKSVRGRDTEKEEQDALRQASERNLLLEDGTKKTQQVMELAAQLMSAKKENLALKTKNGELQRKINHLRS